MMRKQIFFVPLALSAVICANAATGRVLGAEDEKFVVIKAGRVITVTGDDHARGQIVLADGKVRLVGESLDYPPSAKTIDARREVVMPGMILARTRWQLPSYGRSGVFADRGVAREVFLDEIDFAPLVETGFTAVCYYPMGSGVPGPAAVYRTAGSKEAREVGAAYLRITMTNPGGDKKMLISAIDKARAELEKVEKARKDWEESQKKAKEEAAKGAPEKPAGGEKPKEEPKTSAEPPKVEPEKKEEVPAKEAEKKPDVFTPPAIDPTVLPLAEWIRDKKGPPLLFELSRASDLRHLEEVLKRATELPGTQLHLDGTFQPDYHYVIKDLGDRKALVMLEPRIGSLPNTATRHNLAAELALAGCEVILLPTSDTESALRQFRVQLADVVRAGLPRRDALKAVTINPAKALGLAERFGSIEKGKEADFIFLDGDPLDPRTRITRVMTHGEIVWEAPRQP